MRPKTKMVMKAYHVFGNLPNRPVPIFSVATDPFFPGGTLSGSSFQDFQVVCSLSSTATLSCISELLSFPALVLRFYRTLRFNSWLGFRQSGKALPCSTTALFDMASKASLISIIPRAFISVTAATFCKAP